MLLTAVERWGPRFALRRRREPLNWSVLTWTQLGQQVRSLSAGLLALGIRKGDSVAILARTRLEWSLMDYAALSIGAVSVPVYHSMTASQARFLLQDSEARLLVVEDSSHLDQVRSWVQELGLLAVVVMDVMDLRDVKDALLLDELHQRGRRYERENPDAVDEALAAVGPDDLATIVYTSGTTGRNKGVRLLHRNAIGAVVALRDILDVGPDDTTVLCLPLSHIYARLAQFAALDHGYCIAYAQRVDLLSEVLQEIRPSFFFAVPRIFERLYHEVVAGYRDLPPLLQSVVRRGVNSAKESRGIAVDRSPRRGLGQRLVDRLGSKVADKAVFAPVQEALGGRVRFCVSGGAPLNLDVAQFFRVAGVEILEGYGLTETCAAASINPPGANRLGTVGRPLPGIRIRIAADGEVLVQGSVLFDGYHGQPDETALVMEDGWFHTGDVGQLDDAGYLVITDRKKDLLITSGGKNVAPQRVEGALRNSPWIDDAMVFGDRRPYLVALLTLNRDEIEGFARSVGLPRDDWTTLLHEPRIQQLVQGEVDRCNQRLARFEQVRRFRVLHRSLSVAGGELTPTLKVRRSSVAQRNQPLIDSMYAELPRA